MTRSLVALALLVVVDGCARRTDEETRAAFESVRGAPSSERGRGRRARAGRKAKVAAAPGVDPFQRVNDVLGESIAVLGLGRDEAAVTALAQRMCAVAPEAKPTDAGPTYVCFPEPPVEVGGHAFTLELAPSGVIGLQAADLTRDASRSLLEQVRQATAKHCATPFQATDRDANDEHAPDFHICPVDGGSTLAVGRSESGRDRWLVSVSVLASG